MGVGVAMVVNYLQDLQGELEQDLRDAGQLDVDECVHLLVAIREARVGLADVYDLVERVLIRETAERRQFVVDGVGEITVRRSMRRTRWQMDDLVAAVVGRIMDDPHTIFAPLTGELLPYPVIGENVARQLRECVSFSAGKVGGLKELGIAPDEYCDEQPGYMSVQLPPRKVPT